MADLRQERCRAGRRHRGLLGDHRFRAPSAEKFAIAHFNRANGWLAKGELDRAVADLSGAIGLDRSNAKAFYNRGNAWMALGAHERGDRGLQRGDPARCEFRRRLRQPRRRVLPAKATSTAPSSTSMLRSGLRRRIRARSPRAALPGAPRANSLSRSRISTARSRPSRTMRGAQRARRDAACGRPARSRARRFHRGDPARRQVRARPRQPRPGASDAQQFRCCDHRFRRGAARSTPADVDALINRGTALQLKGDLERARADYDEALRIAPEHGGGPRRARQRLSWRAPTMIVQSPTMTARLRSPRFAVTYQQPRARLARQGRSSRAPCRSRQRDPPRADRRSLLQQPRLDLSARRTRRRRR